MINETTDSRGCWDTSSGNIMHTSDFLQRNEKTNYETVSRFVND